MVTQVARLTREWTPPAARADCRALVLDCSNVQCLSTEMLGKLFSLQGRLKQREARLVLSGLRGEVRNVLRWTRLDRFLEIEEG